MAFSQNEPPSSSPTLTTSFLTPPPPQASLRSARSAPMLAQSSPKSVHASDLGLTIPRRVRLSVIGQHYNPLDISRANSPIPTLTPSSASSTQTDISSLSEESESSSIGLDSRIFFRGTTKPAQPLPSDSTFDTSQDTFSDEPTRYLPEDASLRPSPLLSSLNTRTYAYSNQKASGSRSKIPQNGSEVFHSARHSAESSVESAEQSGAGCCSSEEYATAVEDISTSSAESDALPSNPRLPSSHTGTPSVSTHDTLLPTPPSSANAQASFAPLVAITSLFGPESADLHTSPSFPYHDLGIPSRSRSNSASRYPPIPISRENDLFSDSIPYSQAPKCRLITPPRSPLLDYDAEDVATQQHYPRPSKLKSSFVLGDVPPRQRGKGVYSRRPQLDLPVIEGSPSLTIFPDSSRANTPVSCASSTPTELFLFPRIPPPPPTPLSRFSITPSVHNEGFPDENPEANELPIQLEKSEKGSGTWRGHVVRKSLSAIVNGLTGQKAAGSAATLEAPLEEPTQPGLSGVKHTGFRFKTRRKSDAQAKDDQDLSHPMPNTSHDNESQRSLPDTLASRPAGHVSFTFDYPRPLFHDSQQNPQRATLRDVQNTTGHVQARPAKRTSTISASSILLPAPSVCRSSISRRGMTPSSIYSNRSRALLLPEIRSCTSSSSLQSSAPAPSYQDSPARILFFAGFALSPWCWVIGGWLLSTDGKIASHSSPSTSLLPFSMQESTSSLATNQDASTSATFGSKGQSRGWPLSFNPFHFLKKSKPTGLLNHLNSSHEELHTREPTSNGSNVNNVTLYQPPHDLENHPTRVRCPSITFTGVAAPTHDVSSSITRSSRTPSTFSLYHATSRFPTLLRSYIAQQRIQTHGHRRTLIGPDFRLRRAYRRLIVVAHHVQATRTQIAARFNATQHQYSRPKPMALIHGFASVALLRMFLLL